MHYTFQTNSDLWPQLLTATDAGCKAEGYYTDLFEGTDSLNAALGFCTAYSDMTTFYSPNLACAQYMPLRCSSQPPKPPPPSPPPPNQPAVSCVVTITAVRDAKFPDAGYAQAFLATFDSYFVKQFLNGMSPNYFLISDGTDQTSSGYISYKFIVNSQVGSFRNYLLCLECL